MKTAIVFYTILAAMIILPLCGYSLKWIRAGQWWRKLILLAACVVVAGGCYRIYAISLDYQPLLVAERYATAYFVEQSEISPVRYQLSDELSPRYYQNAPEFSVLNDMRIDEEYESPKLVFVSLEDEAGEMHYSVLVMRGVDLKKGKKPEKWVVEAHIAASEEMVQFAQSQNFMRSTQLMKWVKVR